MLNSDHEEADTRMCLHTKDALCKGASSIYIKTVDTDVVIILTGIYFSLLGEHPNMDLWVAFGVGTHYKEIHINSIAEELGREKSMAMPMFHSFTGCDTTSQFFNKGKKSAWEAWKSYPDVTEAFKAIATEPFMDLTLESDVFKLLERYVCVLYDRTTDEESVDEVRQELFCSRSIGMENLPPTQVN